MKRYANSIINEFSTSEGVEKTISSKDKKALSALSGVLGAIEKGGKAVGSDESTSQQAAHYWRVLNGHEKQKLESKDFEKISKLVRGFLGGPKKMHSV